VNGWVRNVRKSSAVRFIDISDGSSMKPVQAVVDKSLPGALEWVVSGSWGARYQRLTGLTG
jgi:aspartyl/asparaginyl-tRNA synthetase